MPKPVSDDDFQEALADLLHEMSADAILAIPGVYEVVSEYFNNKAIDRALENRDGPHGNETSSCDECGADREGDQDLANEPGPHHAESCSAHAKGGI